jgi:hypothetical protein
MLVMCAAVPGFGRAFAESVFMWLRLGQTNLARDVPWPWRAARAQEIERAFGLGLLFLLVPLAVIALLALARARPRFRSPLLVSGAVTAAVYLHYTFSRPDEFHLARGAVPPLLAAVAALVACAGARTRRVAAVALAAFAALSGWVLAPRHGAWARARAPERFPPVMVGGDRLATARIDASLIRSARRAAAEGPRRTRRTRTTAACCAGRLSAISAPGAPRRRAHATRAAHRPRRCPGRPSSAARNRCRRPPGPRGRCCAPRRKRAGSAPRPVPRCSR